VTLGFGLAHRSLKCLGSKFEDRRGGCSRLHPAARQNETRLLNRFCVREHQHCPRLRDDYLITIKIDPEITAIGLSAKSIN